MARLKKERKENLESLCAFLHINSKYKINNFHDTFMNMDVCFIKLLAMFKPSATRTTC